MLERRAYDAAVANFTAALTGDLGEPSEDESRAALYNRACAQAKLGDYDGTKADLTAAVNDYALKFSVATRHGGVRGARSTRRWRTTCGASAPTRPSRTSRPRRRSRSVLQAYAFGGLGAGAFIGLLIILTRLAAATGAGRTLDLGGPIGNLAAAAVAVAAFATLFRGELEAREKTQEKVKRGSAREAARERGGRRTRCS